MRGIANVQPERLAYIVRLRLDYTWSHFRQHLVDGRNCRYYFTHTLLLATHWFHRKLIGQDEGFILLLFAAHDPGAKNHIRPIYNKAIIEGNEAKFGDLMACQALLDDDAAIKLMTDLAPCFGE